MSLRSLQLAVRDTLRNSLLVAPPLYFLEHEISLEPEGRPPPVIGWKWLAVHPVAWSPGDINPHKGIHETYTLQVTLTVKFGEYPQDDTANYLYYPQDEGMEATIRQVIRSIHQNQDVITLANSNLQTNVDRHVKYLEWLDSDPEPRLEGVGWITADKEGAEDRGAYVQSVRFRGGDRLQRATLLE